MYDRGETRRLGELEADEFAKRVRFDGRQVPHPLAWRAALEGISPDAS